ncbi:hypothetical protein KHA96_15575 [Bacillus sp. FJAT-49711]|uniref:hypothetical protein n=1 Tax=Bacillus sp. FJAT-49711 TaxID=2833585 RepID=UPI001BCA4548|nr:hypothetical protein [Bacillus sp. FJAT-49711]MBS4219544.1 hypothetical protein [Bacillus sp. FJAT-49711]MBS4219734.1 hypothetical protein [Bacillus sp. FJAT-49711]
MSRYTVEEITKFFHSHEVKCQSSDVQKWINKTGGPSNDEELTDWDMFDFSEWWSYQGTAYEDGIDDKTKIARLLEEIEDLKREKYKLMDEINTLEQRLDILPF